MVVSLRLSVAKDVYTIDLNCRRDCGVGSALRSGVVHVCRGLLLGGLSLRVYGALSLQGFRTSSFPKLVAAALPAVIHVLLTVIHAWDAEKRIGVRYKWRNGVHPHSLVTIWTLSQSRRSRGRRSDRPGSLPGGFTAHTCSVTSVVSRPVRFLGMSLSVFLQMGLGDGWVRSVQHPCASQRLPPGSHRSMDCPTTLLGVNLSDGRAPSWWRDDAVQDLRAPWIEP